MSTRVGGDERVLEVGDTLDIPAGTVHQMWNAGSDPARVTWRTSPAGRTLEWFEALDAFQRDGDTAAVGAALAEYKDVFSSRPAPRPPPHDLLPLPSPPSPSRPLPRVGGQERVLDVGDTLDIPAAGASTRCGTRELSPRGSLWRTEPSRAARSSRSRRSTPCSARAG